VQLNTDDFAVFDDTESVTYQQRDLTGTVTATFTGVLTLSRATSGGLSGVGSGGQVYADNCPWNIQSSTLPVVPRRGDRIVSPTRGTWEITGDGIDTFTSRYRVDAGRIS
jgi:hypothetical protein